MKQLCLISPGFAFPVGERGTYFPHKELAISLYKRGIKATVVCLGPELAYQDDYISVHAVPMPMNQAPMLASWMPFNSYYMSAAEALWQKYLTLTQSTKFDLIDVPSYLPFDSLTVPEGTAIVVRTYGAEGFGQRRDKPLSVDSMMQENLQAIALLHADSILVDEAADAQNNRWTRKLRNAFTARLMSELESSVLADEQAILPRNDLKTIMLGSSAVDAEWSVECLKAISEYLERYQHVRFLLPIFQREVTHTELQLLGQLKERLAASKLQDRLYIIRPLAINKIGGCVRAADVVVAPARDSGLPSIGIEALYAGKPVIVRNTNPLARFVEMHNCGQVVTNEAGSHELTAAFDRALANLDQGAAAKESVEKLFDDYVNGVLKCYASALESQLGYAEQSGDEASKINSRTGGQKPPSAPSQQQFLAACDRLLYDIHYKTSLRFRVRHWLNRLSQKKRHQPNKS